MAVQYDQGIYGVEGLAGEILVGAKLYFYTTGTTTPLATYSDSALSTPNANPVVADSYGRFGPIWLQASVYKVVLKTSADVTLVTRDPVDGAGLTGSTGSASVGFIAAGAGAVATTQQAKDRETISDTDYSTLAQAATAAAGKVLLITSDRVITAAITLSDGTTVIGNGGSVTVSAVDVNAFNLGNDCVLDGVDIAGPESAVAAADFATGNGVYASGKRNVTVRNCRIHGWQSNGVQIRDCTNVSILNNRLYGNYWTSTSGSDIITYSGTAGARHVITGNYCLSNNSQGITYNTLGLDSEGIITGNVCVALNSSWTEAVIPTTAGSGGANRRHAIMAGYNGGATGSRIVVANNICRNTAWSGIYVQTNTSGGGKMLISNNVCSNNGYETANSLSGGIFVANYGEEIISNNLILNFRGDTTGGITLVCPDAAEAGDLVCKNNTIVDSASNGIFCGNFLTAARIIGNEILSPGFHGIYVGLTAGSAGIGGLTIKGNRIKRTAGMYSGMVLDFGSGTRRSLVKDNEIDGHDSTTANASNTGIAFRAGNVDIVGNRVSNFYYGIDCYAYLATSTRYFGELSVDYNILDTLTYGIGVTTTTATSTLPAEGNVFKSVTNLVGSSVGGASMIKFGRRGGAVIHFEATAIPATGTWILGDTCTNVAGTVGQPKGWTCTTAGSPGTWTSWGNL